MNQRKLILQIIFLKIEIEVKNYYTVGRIDNDLNPIYDLNDNDKKVIHHSACKMLKDYEDDNELYLIADEKLLPDAYKEYIKYENLKYKY
jgi:hypothetical protein